MCRPLRRTRTRPTSRNTFRCFETEGCSNFIRTTRSPTGSSDTARYSRISRRRGSATALKVSEVVDALAIDEANIYSHMGICQALKKKEPPELSFFKTGRCISFPARITDFHRRSDTTPYRHPRNLLPHQRMPIVMGRTSVEMLLCLPCR